MNRTATIWTVIIIIILVIIGVWIYQSNESNPNVSGAPMIPYVASSTTATAQTSVTTPPVNQGTVVVNVASSTKYGMYLIAATNNMTLYTYSKDAPGVSNCSGACASSWPPYAVSASDAMPYMGGPDVNGAISTITRADGSMQVTYNGMPLYFWNGDKTAGDVTGNNVNGFAVAKE